MMNKEKWEVRKLGEVCIIDPQKREAKKVLKDDDLVTFLPMNELGLYDRSINAKYTKTLGEVYKGYTYFADNDVLLAKITPSFENGKLGIANSLMNGIGFGSSEYLVFRCPDYILPEYLFYFFHTNSFKIEGSRLMTGAVGHKRLSKDWIYNYNIPIPTLPEQQRIVSLVDEAFESIDQAKANAEKNLENAKELFKSYLQSVFETKGEGWEEKKLEEIVELMYGFTEKSKSEGDYRYIRITDIDSEGLLCPNGKVYVGKSEAHKIYMLKNNDLVMARTGASFGDVMLYEDIEPSIFASYLIRITFKEQIDNKLYWYFAKSPLYWDQARSLATGAAQPQFNGNAVKQVVFRYPKSINTQQEIIQQLDNLSDEIKQIEINYQSRIEMLDELRKSILEKAFNGEL